jgi:hypothetical protein
VPGVAPVGVAVHAGHIRSFGCVSFMLLRVFRDRGYLRLRQVPHLSGGVRITAEGRGRSGSRIPAAMRGRYPRYLAGLSAWMDRTCLFEGLVHRYRGCLQVVAGAEGG